MAQPQLNSTLRGDSSYKAAGEIGECGQALPARKWRASADCRRVQAWELFTAPRLDRHGEERRGRDGGEQGGEEDEHHGHSVRLSRLGARETAVRATEQPAHPAPKKRGRRVRPPPPNQEDAVGELANPRSSERKG